MRMARYPLANCILFEREYKLGDPMPDGYLDRAAWARAQMKAGARQYRCPRCSLYHFTMAECKEPRDAE